jgi:hypothetical protein
MAAKVGKLHWGDMAAQDVSERVGGAVATEAALAAIPAAARANGQVWIVTADGMPRLFHSTSTDAASDFSIVPAAGSGRFLQYLSGGGAPMLNRIRLLGGGAAIAQADYLTIGSDVYEFRSSTPPAGGTSGRIWVHNGASSAESRANFIKAVNGTVDAAVVTRNGTNTEVVSAAAGVTTGDVIVYSSTAIGSLVPAASATATACTDNLTDAADIWDQATMYGGVAKNTEHMAMVTVTLTADMLTKGNLQVYFPFQPTHCILVNRMRPQNEAVTISGYYVQVVLAAGGTPNNVAADVLDIIAFG